MPVFPGTRPLSAATGSSPRCRRCGAIRALPGACWRGSRRIRRRRRIRSPTRNPEKSCTRCATAKWPRCARCRSGFIMAASIPRRCLFGSRVSMCSAPDDIETLRALWPHIEAALNWIDSWGDPDGDGFIEYHRMTERGARQPGLEGFAGCGLPCRWPLGGRADRARGSARLRLRGQACRRAMRAQAGKQRAGGYAGESRARNSPNAFEESFWCPDLGTYALALDGKKERCAVRTSNAGHLLFCGMIRPERAKLVAEGLMRPQFFTGWGIRTVGKEEARYNPMSYHNGSVWPHDNALIALGFARYGFKSAVDRVFMGMFNAAQLHGIVTAARTVLRLPPRAGARADALPGCLRAAGLGQRHAFRSVGGFARAGIRASHQRNPAAQSKAAALPG